MTNKTPRAAKNRRESTTPSTRKSGKLFFFLLLLLLLSFRRASSTSPQSLMMVIARNSSIFRGGGSNLGLVGQNVHCRRQCVEARSADVCSARSAKSFFRVIFQLHSWMGSRSTFVLCTALPLLSRFRAIRDRLTLDIERKCTLRW